MKGIALLIVGVLLLLGAAGGGYYAYTKYFNASTEPEKPAKPPPPPPPVYVRIPPLVVPVVGAERVEQVITMVVSLLVKDQTAASTISERMARVTDTFMTSIYAAIDEGEILDGSLVKITGLKQRLQTVSNQLFGPDVVKEVLVQTVLQRRL
ncbi:MAG: hypothetical protein WCO00_09250 [Rhodospirillaceae bacterium]